MNVVIATQRLEISEIRDVRRCEVSPDHFVTVADVVIEGASLPISVDVTELNAVELTSALDLDPQAEARETERDTAWVGELVERPTYDQLIAGAKFTDQHRAEVRQKWNEMYSDEAVQARIKARGGLE